MKGASNKRGGRSSIHFGDLSLTLSCSLALLLSCSLALLLSCSLALSLSHSLALPPFSSRLRPLRQLSRVLQWGKYFLRTRDESGVLPTVQYLYLGWGRRSAHSARRTPSFSFSFSSLFAPDSRIHAFTHSRRQFGNSSGNGMATCNATTTRDGGTIGGWGWGWFFQCEGSGS